MIFRSRLKPIDQLADPGRVRLSPSLSWYHLVALGVGAIVGTGIYTLTGIGADRAGPAVVIAFAIAGIVCACAALAYAELAGLMPEAGSAYSYAYCALGEPVAWVIGWSLILEYSVACSAVAVGWSGYAVGALHSWGVDLPLAVTFGPHAGGLVNLPAVAITAAVVGMLAVGTRESASVNAVLVAFKLLALLVFVALALPGFEAANYTPFMPYGFSAHVEDGNARGVMAAAAIVFFAFFGFDAVSTAAEEARRPARDLTIGIIGSMVLSTLIYIAVAGSAVGAASYLAFGKSAEPLAYILRSLGYPAAALAIGAAAVITLPTVILAFMYGQSRIFFAMARDGFLPAAFTRLDPRTQTPLRMTILTGVAVALVAGFLRLDEIAELSNAGTLAAFVAVSGSLLVLRRTDPARPRLFTCPAPWLVAPVAILGCLYLFISLPAMTILRFVVWNLLGIAVYLFYARSRSVVGRTA